MQEFYDKFLHFYTYFTTPGPNKLIDLFFGSLYSFMIGWSKATNLKYQFNWETFRVYLNISAWENANAIVCLPL